MIYIKRITSADITRQIDLTKESANFFGFSETSHLGGLNLTFEDEETQNRVYGTVKKTGHTTTIIGDIYREVKSRCVFDDIIVFSTTRNNLIFRFLIVKQSNPDYENFNKSLALFGSHSGVLRTTTHLVAALDGEAPEIKNSSYRPYITAIKSKPFLLLAGISGTGKSRIVRELARACWDIGSEEYKAHKPRNFEMIQVKPNWHDSSELLGYVSRISGSPEYIAGDFLKFIAKAWTEQEVPYFLCLDEMNLAPVEQYFAEYLSVIESRKVNEEGVVVTDPIIKGEYKNERDPETHELVPKPWYKELVDNLLSRCSNEKSFAITTQLTKEGICLPPNLIVVGTVNMDETTFSFSRKVLDRAMTIEMNEVDLHGGLTERNEVIGKLGLAELVGTTVEGVDVYSSNQDVCETVLSYLQAVNDLLEGTPFKIAYRTRNEFLLYVVNNLPYNKDKDGNEIDQKKVIARALDEITSMKILSRIEGDETKVNVLFNDDKLKNTIAEALKAVCEDFNTDEAVSVKKLTEMKGKLNNGYTSFWS